MNVDSRLEMTFIGRSIKTAYDEKLLGCFRTPKLNGKIWPSHSTFDY